MIKNIFFFIYLEAGFSHSFHICRLILNISALTLMIAFPVCFSPEKSRRASYTNSNGKIDFPGQRHRLASIASRNRLTLWLKATEDWPRRGVEKPFLRPGPVRMYHERGWSGYTVPKMRLDWLKIEGKHWCLLLQM